MFAALLREEFRDTPGELNVALGHYEFSNGRGMRLIRKGRDGWKQSVSPGSRIYMSMVVHRNETEALQYPAWDDTEASHYPILHDGTSGYSARIWQPTAW